MLDDLRPQCRGSAAGRSNHPAPGGPVNAHVWIRHPATRSCSDRGNDSRFVRTAWCCLTTRRTRPPGQSISCESSSTSTAGGGGGHGLPHQQDCEALEGADLKVAYDPRTDSHGGPEGERAGRRERRGQARSHPRLRCIGYIQIREADPDDNIDIEEGVTVDVDEHGHIVGVEILDASKRLSPSDLTRVTIETLPLEIMTP